MKGRGYKTISTDWESMYKEAKKELLADDAHIAKYNQIIDKLEAEIAKLKRDNKIITDEAAKLAIKCGKYRIALEEITGLWDVSSSSLANDFLIAVNIAKKALERSDD